MCDHAGWGRYEGEVGDCPPPAEMKRICQHKTECPTCKYSVAVNCDCPGARSVAGYNTAMLGGFETR